MLMREIEMNALPCLRWSRFVGCPIASFRVSRIALSTPLRLQQVVMNFGTLLCPARHSANVNELFPDKVNFDSAVSIGDGWETCLASAVIGHGPCDSSSFNMQHR
jgi:hypothetical protein